MGHRQFARTKKSRPHRTHQSCAWSRTRGIYVGAKHFSPVRAPQIRHHPTINYRHAMNRGARPNLPSYHGCTGEKYFAPTCAIDIHSPNHPPSSHHKSWCAPKSTTHHGCTGEKYFAPTCANDVRSTAVRPGVRVGCLTAPPRRRGARLNARHRAVQPGVCSTNCNLAPMQQQCRAWNASLPTPAYPAAPGQTKPSTRSCL